MEASLWPPHSLVLVIPSEVIVRLISLLLEFAAEWKQELGDILSQNKVHLSRSSASHQGILFFVQLWKITLAPSL